MVALNKRNIKNEIDVDWDIELLILLILGLSSGKLSMLHLQKIFFLLWETHPQIRNILRFYPHYKGPYSHDLKEQIESPIYLSKHWKYIPPSAHKHDKILGGYVQLTDEGRRYFKELYKQLQEESRKNPEVAYLLTLLQAITKLYSNLEWDELLLLIYTYPPGKHYTKESELLEEILKHKDEILDRLIKKGVIPEDAKTAFIERIKRLYRK